MRYKIAAVLILIVSLLGASLVSAQQSNAGQGLEISPPLRDLKVNPGQTITTNIRLRNVTKGTLVTKAQLNDFVAAGEDGQPKLLLDSNEQSPYSIKAWLSTIPSLTLQPQEQVTLDITITVPKDASPGGHYGVVRFTARPPNIEDTGVSLSASIGVLMLVNVSGNVNEQAKIAELYTSQNGKKRSVFEYGPVTITLRLQNSGNVHIKPSGTVRITNMFGKQAGSFQFNQPAGNVLPGSIRRFDQVLNKKLLFGRYRAQADVVYGADKKIITASQTFWVIPYKLVAMAITLIIGLVFFIRYYNRYILKRAQKKQSDKQADGGKKTKKKKS